MLKKCKNFSHKISPGWGIRKIAKTPKGAQVDAYWEGDGDDSGGQRMTKGGARKRWGAKRHKGERW